MRQAVRQLVSVARAVINGEPRLNLVKKESGRVTSAKDGGEIPQAAVREENLQSYELRDWRTHFSKQLRGKGLEIGPLHRPMVRHEEMDIDYIDRCTVAELRAHYPELKDLPLIEPTILGDAETLGNIADHAYDFVIAAHVIEHMRNPLQSLQQWCRVVKPGGKIYLVVPDKRATFDVKRVRTTLEHMILDFLRPSPERDYEHFLDYAVHVHNLSAEKAIEEADRLLKTDYSIHFHVFLPTDVLNLVRWFSTNVQSLDVLEGPSMTPGSDEFHLMVRVK